MSMNFKDCKEKKTLIINNQEVVIIIDFLQR